MKNLDSLIRGNDNLNRNLDVNIKEIFFNYKKALSTGSQSSILLPSGSKIQPNLP